MRAKTHTGKVKPGNAKHQLGAAKKHAGLGLGAPRESGNGIQPTRDYDALFGALRGLFEDMRKLNQQAVRDYTPVVEDIIRSGDCDTRLIERTLDSLLDHCGYDPALELYRRLCRHYYFIDQAAAVFYVNAYRGQWDSAQEAQG